MDEISAQFKDFRETRFYYGYLRKVTRRTPKTQNILRKILLYLLSSNLHMLDFKSPPELLYSPLPTVVNILQQIRGFAYISHGTPCCILTEGNHSCWHQYSAITRGAHKESAWGKARGWPSCWSDLNCCTPQVSAFYASISNFRHLN